MLMKTASAAQNGSSSRIVWHEGSIYLSLNVLQLWSRE